MRILSTLALTRFDATCDDILCLPVAGAELDESAHAVELVRGGTSPFALRIARGSAAHCARVMRALADALSAGAVSVDLTPLETQRYQQEG